MHISVGIFLVFKKERCDSFMLYIWPLGSCLKAQLYTGMSGQGHIMIRLNMALNNFPVWFALYHQVLWFIFLLIFLQMDTVNA